MDLEVDIVEVNATLEIEVAGAIVDVATVTLADNPTVATTNVGEQGPPGPPGASGSGTFTATNQHGATVRKGAPLKLVTNGCDLAQANSATNRAIGVNSADCNSGQPATIIRQGVVTSSDWTAVTGSSQLVANSDYCLVQGSAGMLSTSIPMGSGDIQQWIGKAISTDSLLVDVQLPILL